MCTGNGPAPGSVAEALRMANASLDYLNGPAAGELDAASCGAVLKSLGEIQAKFTAAHAAVLARFDAANAHDADGYGTSATWLAAMTQMTRQDARAAVRQMRQFRGYRDMADALAAAKISESCAAAIAEWTRKLPAELRRETIKILVQAAVAGASLDDLKTIAAIALNKWRAQQPDGDDGFDDRYVRVATTFGGAGCIRGNLTPECAAAVQAVMEALGKKAGPEDTRTEGQRFHDALQLGCELLIRAKMVPDRAGADTHVAVHVPLSARREMSGASELEAAWLAGEPGYLSGKDAETAACDALTFPVVTGHADMTVIDKIIALALPAAGHAGGAGARALRYAIARLAIDFVSGPGGIASALRTGLLEPPFNTPSLPLDIGHSDTIPAHIRRAVILRDRHCAWPGGCDTPAAACDVHHLTHQKDGGPTSATGCKLFCNFHHDVAIHRPSGITPEANRSARDGAAQEGLDEGRGGGQLGRGARHANLAAREHVSPVGDRQDGPGALLDDQHRGAALGEAADVVFEQRAGDGGGEVRGRLVQQEHRRLQHQHAAHGQHLPLTAAELARGPAQHRAEPREDGDHLVDPGPHLLRPQQVAAHLQVLPDGQRREHVIHLRHVADSGPGDILGRPVGDVQFPDDDRARADAHHPDQALEQGALPRAVGTDQRDHLAGLDVHRHAADHRVAAIARGHSGRPQHGAAGHEFSRQGMPPRPRHGSAARPWFPRRGRRPPPWPPRGRRTRP